MNTDLRIQDFGVLLADGAKDSLGDGYSVEYKEVIKNNGVVYHAIVIKKEEENVAPTIYIDELYREYLKGKKVKTLTDEIVKFYFSGNLSRNVNIDFFTDFSKACAHLCFKAINLEKNRQILSEVPYRQIEDLAMVPICCVNDRDLGSGNIMINRKHLELWEISEEELWENIYENAEKISPVKVVGISEYLSKQTGIPFEEYLSNVYVVSNSEMRNGASAAFFPGVLKKIADKIEADLIVIPSSVHETIVMPSYMGDKAEFTIAQMIREVNESVVTDEEILGDNAYFYDRAENKLKIYEE
ncbi:MAG: DUF5688 family protein [Butyrivibrio sp.]|nr:DUF5688 family protein [Butyrivibrio sp.]